MIKRFLLVMFLVSSVYAQDSSITYMEISFPTQEEIRKADSLALVFDPTLYMKSETSFINSDTRPYYWNVGDKMQRKIVPTKWMSSETVNKLQKKPPRTCSVIYRKGGEVLDIDLRDQLRVQVSDTNEFDVSFDPFFAKGAHRVVKKESDNPLWMDVIASRNLGYAMKLVKDTVIVAEGISVKTDVVRLATKSDIIHFEIDARASINRQQSRALARSIMRVPMQRKFLIGLIRSQVRAERAMLRSMGVTNMEDINVKNRFDEIVSDTIANGSDW